MAALHKPQINKIKMTKKMKTSFSPSHLQISDSTLITAQCASGFQFYAVTYCSFLTGVKHHFSTGQFYPDKVLSATINNLKVRHKLRRALTKKKH